MKFMGSEPSREQFKFIVNLMTSVVTLLVAGMVTWTASEIKSMGQAVVRLETIQAERTEQMKRMEVMVAQIVPRAEIETRLLAIKTDLSSQQVEMAKLNLEIEKLKSFNSITHPQKGTQ